MGHYACIAIGINHYQFLAPLSYGQADAYSLRQFLVNQANLPSDQFLLLSDNSPLVDNFSTYPTQENIWRHLEADEQASWHTANYRWFFFSGYGVSWEGVDYLMPIDGNPDDIPRTAIPMRSLLATLKDAGGENLLVLLDINRSPGLPTGLAVGEETIAIAQEMNIALILSSQLDQFSHEAVALGNGLFTAALLEALHYYYTDTTLSNLDQYLRSYLPQLCQHHYRPIQNPLMVVPVAEARQHFILPTVATPVTIPADLHLMGLNVNGDRNNTNNGASVPRQPALEIPSDNYLNVPTPAPPTPIDPNLKFTPYHPQKILNFDSSLGLQLIFLGGGAVLVLLLTLAAILLNNRKILIKTPAATIVPESNTIATTTRGLPPSERLSVNKADLEQAKRLLLPNQASLFNQAITQARKVEPGDPLYPQAQQDMARWSRVILDLAQGRAASQKFDEAIATAKLVPDDDPVTYQTTQQAIASWQLMAQQYPKNQAVIQEAQAQLQSNQATSYRRGINILSKIPSDQPGYNQAQKLIEQWSRRIYLIAQSRASQGKLESAIETVALVPSGTSSFEAAQKALIKWKQGQR